MTVAETPASGSEQAEYWNGRIGRLWADEYARFDRIFAELTQALLARARPQPGETILDVGCGAGGLALALARAAGPSGRVAALDLSDPMLAAARQRDANDPDPTRAPICWQLGDAAAFPLGAEYDLIASRFGTMFFDDPAAAFTHLRRALKPGGRLTMLCWRRMDENGWAKVPLEAVSQLVGPPEPSAPGAPGPFSFAEPERVRGILDEAGFSQIAWHAIDVTNPTGDASPGTSALADAVEFSLKVGPAAGLIREADDATKEKARAALEAALAPYLVDGAVRLGAACWIYEAMNPA